MSMLMLHRTSGRNGYTPTRSTDVCPKPEQTTRVEQPFFGDVTILHEGSTTSFLYNSLLTVLQTKKDFPILYCYNADTKEIIAFDYLRNEVQRVAAKKKISKGIISQNGKLLIVFDKRLLIYQRIPTLSLVHKPKYNNSINDVIEHNENELILREAGSIDVYNVQTGTETNISNYSWFEYPSMLKLKNSDYLMQYNEGVHIFGSDLEHKTGYEYLGNEFIKLIEIDDTVVGLTTTNYLVRVDKPNTYLTEAEGITNVIILENGNIVLLRRSSIDIVNRSWETLKSKSIKTDNNSLVEVFPNTIAYIKDERLQIWDTVADLFLSGDDISATVVLCASK